MNRNLAIIILMLAILGVGLYAVQRQSESDVQNGNNNGQKYEDNNDETPNGTIGEETVVTETFTGYYAVATKESESGEKKECPVFISYKNETPLFAYFSELVRRGNTINSLAQDGNLRLNINLDNLSSTIKSRIINSSKENPIDLVIQKRPLEGKGADACTSFVDILSVE